MIHSKPDLYKGRIHPPHQHAVDLPATRCLQQFLPGLSFASSKIGGQLNGPFAFGTTDGPEIFHQTSIQASDAVIWTRGAHTLHMGFQINRYRNNYVPATSSDGAAGQIGFSGTYTGNSEADFFLGLPSYIASTIS